MSKQITFQPTELPLRVEVDHATKFRIVAPGGRTLLSGHCSLEQANVFAASPELLESLEWALGQMEMDAFEPEFPEVKKAWDTAHEILARAAGRAT